MFNRTACALARACATRAAPAFSNSSLLLRPHFCHSVGSSSSLSSLSSSLLCVCPPHCLRSSCSGALPLGYSKMTCNYCRINYNRQEQRRFLGSIYHHEGRDRHGHDYFDDEDDDIYELPCKSDTCFATTGGPLTEYETESEAWRGAVHARQRFGPALVPYQCGRCDWWHLAPRKPRIDYASLCRCVCADGRTRKQAYNSHDEAQRRAQMLGPGGMANCILGVYRCTEDPRYWHITSTQ